jgi:two-component system, OmpR family, response regulator AdeR
MPHELEMTTETPFIPRTPEKIWILDGSASETVATQNILGREYSLQAFSLLRDLERMLSECKRQDLEQPDLLLTEVYLQDGSLIDFLEAPTTALPPFMIVSTTSTPQTIVECLKRGAEDYFLKPLNANLLRSKIERFFDVKRLEKMKQNIGLQLDRFGMTAKTKKHSATLTVKEFQILTRLLDAYPEGIGRHKVIQGIWRDVNVVSKTFDVHLFHLRRKLETLGFEIRFDRTLYFLTSSKGKKSV